jgi:5-methylcytosine-specific restriction enzyme subunit McrC
MKASVPIENIYYLFCYAWERFSEGRSIAIGKTESPQIWDLFASILTNGVTRLLRRGLDRSYVELRDDLSFVRGRIITSQTLRRNLLFYGRAHCEFDELRHDILQNQIIKATLAILANVKELDPTLRHNVLKLRGMLFDISDIKLSRSHFRRIQLSRNNGHYDLLLKICDLIVSALLPEEDGQGGKFSDILDDEVRMSAVFEAFVRKFFEAEQRMFSVRNRTLVWNAKALDPAHDQYIPEMLTDITLRSKSRTIVIDTKYYKETLREHRGRKRIKSENLYQLYSYVKKCSPNDDAACPVEGILLYPAVKESLDLRYVIDGHPIRIKTVDLDQHWTQIHGQLLSLLSAN